jgi:hypothetical protein
MTLAGQLCTGDTRVRLDDHADQLVRMRLRLLEQLLLDVRRLPGHDGRDLAEHGAERALVALALAVARRRRKRHRESEQHQHDETAATLAPEGVGPKFAAAVAGAPKGALTYVSAVAA